MSNDSQIFKIDFIINIKDLYVLFCFLFGKNSKFIASMPPLLYIHLFMYPYTNVLFILTSTYIYIHIYMMTSYILCSFIHILCKYLSCLNCLLVYFISLTHLVSVSHKITFLSNRLENMSFKMKGNFLHNQYRIITQEINFRAKTANHW